MHRAGVRRKLPEGHRSAVWPSFPVYVGTGTGPTRILARNTPATKSWSRSGCRRGIPGVSERLEVIGGQWNVIDSFVCPQWVRGDVLLCRCGGFDRFFLKNEAISHLVFFLSGKFGAGKLEADWLHFPIISSCRYSGSFHMPLFSFSQFPLAVLLWL